MSNTGIEGAGPVPPDRSAESRNIDWQAERQIAIDMYKREHDRWYQWALFFFGSIASIFVIAHQSSGAVPLWAAALGAALTSISWTGAAFAILMTSHAWEATIEELEDGEISPGPAFTVFRDYLAAAPWWSHASLFRDLRRPRVTFILVCMGIFATVGFSVLTLALLAGWTSERPPLSSTPCFF